MQSFFLSAYCYYRKKIASIYSDDLSVCPVICVKQYLTFTEWHRGSNVLLFLTQNKPFEIPPKILWLVEVAKGNSGRSG